MNKKKLASYKAENQYQLQFLKLHTYTQKKTRYTSLLH